MHNAWGDGQLRYLHLYTLEYTLEHCEDYSFDEGKALVLTKVRWHV